MKIQEVIPELKGVAFYSTPEGLFLEVDILDHVVRLKVPMKDFYALKNLLKQSENLQTLVKPELVL